MISLDFLLSLDPFSIALLFWFTLLFDVPRYVIGLAVISILGRKKLPPIHLTTSAIVAGHNESAAIRRCVESIEADQIIVVDDGSTDGMCHIVQQLKAEGLVDKAFCLPVRSSKITAINLALTECTGEIVLIIDADTVLAPGAIAEALPYFADPEVGGVCCNLKVANETASLTTRFQAIEYAVSISMGRQVSDALGLLPNISGAFGAIRRSALHHVGGLDMEVAEDAALTMKLRQAGYKIRFAPEAVAQTNVPETITALTLQRLRWDAGLVTIWCRKWIGNISPLLPNFRLIEALLVLDVIWFSVALPLALPVYVVWLWINIGEFSFTLLGAIFLGLAALDVLVCVLARIPLRLFPYIPLYTLMQNLVMRPVRLIAVLGELIFVTSHRDNYIPEQQRWEAVVKRVVIKWTYLLAVIGFGVWVFNVFFGGNVYLRAEGMVLAQPAVVATEYNVTVRDVMVKEGERVSEGQVVVQISSQQVLEGLARLSSEAASRAARLVELDVRSEVVNAMLAPAEHREAVAVEGKNQLNEIYKKGLLPVISRTAAAEQAYNGQRDAEVLRAEKRALTDQIKMLAGATSQADRALSDLLDAFDRGRVHAPITGTVSAVLANRGAVVRAGDPLLELVGDHRFVAAWIPVGRWYDLKVGQSVAIDAGNGKLPGKISRIGTVASALPREFQKAFTPTERLQLIWIEFDKDVTPPPYFTKVTVS